MWSTFVLYNMWTILYNLFVSGSLLHMWSTFVLHNMWTIFISICLSVDLGNHFRQAGNLFLVSNTFPVAKYPYKNCSAIPGNCSMFSIGFWKHLGEFPECFQKLRVVSSRLSFVLKLQNQKNQLRCRAYTKSTYPNPNTLNISHLKW